MEKSNRKILIGRVVSDKMEKTRVVSVQRVARHSLYGKIVRKNKKYKIHDENNQSHKGDLVKIVESRPMSKDKKWRLAEVLEKTQL